MKLLIVTQVVDINDPLLGFFHRWIEEFSTHVDSIEVICLKEGQHTLPKNVRVHSLGKEAVGRLQVTGVRFQVLRDGFRKLEYGIRFLSLVWQLRKNYDTVFVHMNPEYMLLAGLFWRLRGTRTALWYNHPQGGFRHRVACTLANVVFFTSSYSASARYKKALRMPAGVDTEIFKPQKVMRDRHQIYAQGRIMRSKRVHVLFEAMKLLHAESIPASLVVVGPEDPEYGRYLRSAFAPLIENGKIVMKGSVPNHETPLLYGGAGVSVNLAASGHFDKSVLEAMACETPVIISSKAFEGLVPPEWTVFENDPHALADALQKMFLLPEKEFRTLGALERENVVKSESLSALSQTLMKALSL